MKVVAAEMIVSGAMASGVLAGLITEKSALGVLTGASMGLVCALMVVSPDFLTAAGFAEERQAMMRGVAWAAITCMAALSLAWLLFPGWFRPGFNPLSAWRRARRHRRYGDKYR